MAIEIVPAILERTLDDVAMRLESVRGAARDVQLDVVDGLLAPNRSWPYGNQYGKEELARIVAQEEGLPLWEDFDFEIDLMVRQAAPVVMDWVAAGASRIVIHTASKDALEALHLLQSSRGGEIGIVVGIALPSDASPEALAAFDGLYDFVQVMGIAQVGFQGQPFDPRALVLISQLHERYPERTMQVDGGVGEAHVRECVAVGATRLISGSTIFGAESPKQMIEVLRKLANAQNL